MWLLRNDEKGLIYRVTPGKQHIISRKEGDLLLIGDQSISRKHAQLSVEDENESEGIILKDLGSKYGTFVVIGDGELTQLSPTQEVTLRSDDTIKFGIQWNCWRVEFVPLLVATSTLTQEEKTEVKKLVTELGGRVVGDWQDKCTHLTMNKLTVTVKVVCALAAAQPIVTPAYWTRFTQCLSAMQATLPECKDYLPPLAEAVLNPSEVSFTPNSGRCKLFDGCTFVPATAKQLSRIKPMITAAGGHVVEYFSNTCSEDKVIKNNLIIMQHSANVKQGSQQSQIPDGYIPLARKLRSKGIRCIPESEIGFSVLYCSMAQYCNPRFSAQSLLGSSSLEATQPVAVVCPNSEESNLESTCPVLSTSKKRSRGDIDDNEVQETKKPDLRIGSEDMFGSQQINKTKSSGRASLSLKKSISSNGIGNFSKEKSPDQRVNIDPGASLDMFAPSGVKSKGSSVHISAETKPSCEDLFGPSRSRQENQKKDISDEFSFTSKKPQEKVMNKGEEVSFTSNINDNKTRKRTADIDDVFSFVSSKKANKVQGAMEDDVFSFTSNKKSNNEKMSGVMDEFSFVSTERPNKRSRPSNPDMFASSDESHNDYSYSVAGPSKIRKSENPNESSFLSHKDYSYSVAGPSKIRKFESQNELSFLQKNRHSMEDDPFAFPIDKPKNNSSNMNFDDQNTVKIALFSKEDEPVPGPSGLQNLQKIDKVEDPPAEKKLITYSKLMPMPAEKDIESKEMDELAKELHNTTIVVVKPLVVAKPSLARSPVATSGKNFKKFHKVVGMNKRVVPHIIGGSDLVPHYELCKASGDLLPLSPQQMLPPQQQTPVEDEWSFRPNKRMGILR